MPRYTFELQDGEHPIGDEDGVWLDNRDHAVDHAQNVARQLMTARERETRAWRLDVYEDGEQVCQIPFASIDPTLDCLDPILRTEVERGCDTLRDFQQAVSATRAIIQESRALVARSRGKPYLATDRGKPTIAVSLQSQKPSEKK
jgi:hypothetical protein